MNWKIRSVHIHNGNLQAAPIWNIKPRILTSSSLNIILDKIAVPTRTVVTCRPLSIELFRKCLTGSLQKHVQTIAQLKMPSREPPSYSSSRVQRASRLNALEHARLQQQLMLLEKARLHQARLTNQDIRLTSTALEYILVRNDKVCLWKISRVI